jgi:hypothetical protein
LTAFCICACSLQFKVQLATEHCRSLCHKLQVCLLLLIGAATPTTTAKSLLSWLLLCCQVVELQIDSSVYTQESLAALSKVGFTSSGEAVIVLPLKNFLASRNRPSLMQVHGHIKAREDSLRAMLHEVQDALKSYAELGPAFQQVREKELMMDSQVSEGNKVLPG